MITVENVEVWGFEHAIRGARNPMNSWAKSDSGFEEVFEDVENLKTYYVKCADIGHNDLDLMRRLYRAGTEHRKYARQIFVSMDITAPLYWWKEYDTYKVGTTANSCSTMHKIHAKEFTLDDFSHEHLSAYNRGVLENIIIVTLNANREFFLADKSKDCWWQMIQLLPSSYNQKRTVTMTYENVFSIIKQRRGHKLDEWNTFVDTLRTLPYVEAIMSEEKAA